MLYHFLAGISDQTKEDLDVGNCFALLRHLSGCVDLHVLGLDVLRRRSIDLLVDEDFEDV
jgi:hypothetical protein